MSSEITNNPSSSISVSPPKFENIKELEQRLTDVTLSTMQKFLEDNETRLKGYKEDPSLLDGGIWYPNDYFFALSSMKNDEKCKRNLQTLIKCNSFFNGYVSKNFSLVKDNFSLSGFKSCTYILKENVKASEGLKSFVKGISFLDCTASTQLAHISALLDVLGEEKFDQIFDAKSVTPINYW